MKDVIVITNLGAQRITPEEDENGMPMLSGVKFKIERPVNHLGHSSNVIEFVDIFDVPTDKNRN